MIEDRSHATRSDVLDDVRRHLNEHLPAVVALRNEAVLCENLPTNVHGRDCSRVHDRHDHPNAPWQSNVRIVCEGHVHRVDHEIGAGLSFTEAAGYLYSVGSGAGRVSRLLGRTPSEIERNTDEQHADASQLGAYSRAVGRLPLRREVRRREFIVDALAFLFACFGVFAPMLVIGRGKPFAHDLAWIALLGGSGMGASFYVAFNVW